MRPLLIMSLVAMILGGSSAQAQGPAPRVVRIDIQGNKYNNNVPVTIHVGDSVIWVNKDRMPHTASRYSSTDGFNTGFIPAGAESEPIMFLKESSNLTYGCDIHEDPNAPMQGTLVVAGMTTPDHTHHESLGIHSMLITGQDPNQIFGHHYALFNNPNHSYHVTIEAMIDEPSPRAIYAKWRKDNPESRATIDPEVFLLGEIKPGRPTRDSFMAKFSEYPNKPPAEEVQWGTVIPGLENVRIKILRIIQFRAFDPDAKYPERMTYQLYGNPKEVFLAHEVTEGPSFQQVVQLKDVPSFLTPDIIRSAPLVTFITKRIASVPSRVMKTAVLDNTTHLLLTPPINTLNPKPPLVDGEEAEVLIGDDPAPRKITIEKSIWEEFRILNR
jgi:plastocyanin